MSLWWQQLVLVMAGGALGAGGRFLIGGWLTRTLGSGFPWGTLTVNLLGSLLAGLLFVWLEGRGPSALLWRSLLMVGMLGALTTWSALIVELELLGRTQGLTQAGLYLAVSLAGSLLLIVLGMRVGHWLR